MNSFFPEIVQKENDNVQFNSCFSFHVRVRECFLISLGNTNKIFAVLVSLRRGLRFFDCWAYKSGST